MTAVRLSAGEEALLARLASLLPAAQGGQGDYANRVGVCLAGTAERPVRRQDLERWAFERLRPREMPDFLRKALGRAKHGSPELIRDFWCAAVSKALGEGGKAFEEAIINEVNRQRLPSKNAGAYPRFSRIRAVKGSNEMDEKRKIDGVFRLVENYGANKFRDWTFAAQITTIWDPVENGTGTGKGKKQEKTDTIAELAKKIGGAERAYPEFPDSYRPDTYMEVDLNAATNRALYEHRELVKSVRTKPGRGSLYDGGVSQEDFLKSLQNPFQRSFHEWEENGKGADGMNSRLPGEMRKELRIAGNTVAKAAQLFVETVSGWARGGEEHVKMEPYKHVDAEGNETRAFFNHKIGALEVTVYKKSGEFLMKVTAYMNEHLAIKVGRQSPRNAPRWK